MKCPWHDYPVRLRDGAKPYQSMKFDPVTRQEGLNDVWVVVSNYFLEFSPLIGKHPNLTNIIQRG